MSSVIKPLLSSSTWLHDALANIGTATIVTDATGRVLFMNTVAEMMTGWPEGEAAGLPLANVFRVENETTRQPVANPVTAVLESGNAIGLANHIVLVARDGREWILDDGAAPIRNESGEIAGAVLVFRDVTVRRRAEMAVEEALAFSEVIVATIREPLIVLDAELRVRSANPAYFRVFAVTPEVTEGRSFFDIGDHQWEIPQLRELLEQILPTDSHFDDVEVDHDFPGIGRRLMNLNARRLPATGRRSSLILLAIEDITERRRATEDLALSESRYRRLFETAQDGILLVDPVSRRIFDANPFLTDLLGYPRAELVGKELWEIGLFRDIESNKSSFRTLQENRYIRYDNLPLRTNDGRRIDVEFVSNVYQVGETDVIQCNIRDVTDRKRAEDDLRAARMGLEIRVAERTAELARTNNSLQDEIVRREHAESDRRTLQQQLTTVQEDERHRIARELHDQLGQHLTAIGLGLKVAKDATANPSPERDRLQSLQSMTDLIGKEIHHLAMELRPTALDDLGLQVALINYVERWSERSGVTVDFHAYGLDEDRLPPPVETVLYRVIQEALTNVYKHARARHASVVLQRLQGHVSAVVEDDGKGFEFESIPRNRLGILGMRERVALVGGTLVVESSDGGGTAVIARIPLEASRELEHS